MIFLTSLFLKKSIFFFDLFSEDFITFLIVVVQVKNLEGRFLQILNDLILGGCNLFLYNTKLLFRISLIVNDFEIGIKNLFVDGFGICLQFKLLDSHRLNEFIDLHVESTFHLCKVISQFPILGINLSDSLRDPVEVWESVLLYFFNLFSEMKQFLVI